MWPVPISRFIGPPSLIPVLGQADRWQRIMQTNDRNQEWQRNPRLEARLAQLSRVLERCTPEDICAELPEPRCIFIVGAPRSGTTLVLQWLAATGLFAYPSNIISRFWRAPYVGELVQQILLDPKADFRDELFDLQARPNGAFRSDLGKTRGALSPNEFWYFWRHFGGLAPGAEFAFDPIDNFDFVNLRKSLSAWTVVADAPIALKAMIINWHIREFAESLPKCVFLYLKRDPLDTMISLLQARRDYFGDTAAWYSFRVPEYHRLAGLSAEEQVAAQVAAHDRDIPRQLAAIPPAQVVRIEYEAFCRDPCELLQRIAEMLGLDIESAAVPIDMLAPRVGKLNSLPRATREKLEEYYSRHLGTGLGSA